MKWVCAKCALTRETAGNRQPRDWKKIHGEDLCGSCVKNAYIIRAHTFCVVEPLSCGWKDLEASLREVWGAATACSNWIMTKLFAADPGRLLGATKLPPMPRTYFYPEARRLWPDLVPNTVSSLEQEITAKYRKHRFAILWTGKEALPSFRYPQPLPIHNREWRCEREDGRPVVALRLTQNGGWIRLRLKGGPRYARQLRAFDLLESGEAISGAAAIYRRGAGKEIFVKLVARMPRAAEQERSGELHVRTDPDSMFVGLNEKDAVLWNKHADQARRWAMEHRRQLQRWADDSKFERRPVPAFSVRRQQAAARYHRRMDTLCHQTAAEIAGYAARRKFAAVVLTDIGQRFLDEFPWFRLRALIAEKLDAAGITFEFRELKPEQAATEAEQ